MNTLKSNNRGMAVSIAGVSVLAIAAILLLSAPFISFAAGETVTVNATAQYQGQVSISGVVSPTPSSGTAVAISVSDPNGVQVAANTVLLNSTGGFSYSFAAGSSWVNGTYTVVATWAQSSVSSPVSGITTFTYGKATTTTTQTSGQTGVTTTVFYNATTTVVAQTTTTVVQQTTVTMQPVTSVTTVQQNSTTTVVQTSSLDLALAAVAIIIAIVAIVLVFMRKK